MPTVIPYPHKGGSGSGGSGTPASPDKSVQFNDGGAFGGSADFTFDFAALVLAFGHEGLTSNFQVPTTTTSNTSGGSLRFITADGLGSGDGGNFDILLGNAGASGSGGFFSLYAGIAGGDGNYGGDVTISAGDGGTGNSFGGNLSLFAAGGGATGGDGGYVRIQGGHAQAGDGYGGNISLRPGRKNGTGENGEVYISSPDDISAILKTDILTGNRNLQFPDNDGRFVLSVNGSGPNSAGDVTVTGGSGTVTSVGATAPAAGFTISGSPITTSGTFVFTLANDLAAVEGLAANGIAARTASSTWTVRTITGTSNRITMTNGDGVSGNPTVDIAATYVGQTSITTLGTVATGTWNATAITTSFGGTGLTSWTQGDIPYYTSGTVLSKLAKNTSATRYIANTGTSNAPAWAQVNLANGVTGSLPWANIVTPTSSDASLTISGGLDIVINLAHSNVWQIWQGFQPTTPGLTTSGIHWHDATQQTFAITAGDGDFGIPEMLVGCVASERATLTISGKAHAVTYTTP